MITGSRSTTSFSMDEISTHTHKCPDNSGGKFGNISYWPADANVNDRWYKVRWLLEFVNTTMGSVFVLGCHVVLGEIISWWFGKDYAWGGTTSLS